MLTPVVWKLLQDSRGFLWFATNSGLSRFDGHTIYTYEKNDGLPADKIRTLFEDREGTLWIGTESGCASCLPPVGRHVDFTIHQDLAGTFVYSFAEDRNGTLWFATSKGLAGRVDDEFRTFSLPNSPDDSSIASLAVGKSGKLWLGTSRGLYCFKNSRPYTLFQEKGWPRSTVTSLLFDAEENLWVGTLKGLYRLGKEGFMVYSVNEGLSHNSVISLGKDADGNIWVGTWDGASRFSKGKFYNYNIRNGLPNSVVYSISPDREGNLWFATHGGVGKLSSTNIKNYTPTQGLPDKIVVTILRDRKNRLWFGTSEGLGCFAGGEFKNYDTRHGLPVNGVNELEEDTGGNIVIGTFRGLSVLSPDSGAVKTFTRRDGLPSGVILGLCACPDGTVWIGHREGLTRLKGGKLLPPSFDIAPGIVSGIQETGAGELWFLLDDRLHRRRGDQVTGFSVRDGLPGNKITDIYKDRKGSLWLVSKAGLTKFEDGVFKHFSPRDHGLAGNVCDFIFEDQKGGIWTGNTRGLAYFDGKTFKGYSNERLGLTGRSWLAGLQDGNGALWFGGTQGATTFFAPPVKRNMIPPPTYITGIKVLEEDIPLSRTAEFSYGRNMFRFTFAGVSFTAPEAVKYKYRLEGVDENWQITKDRALFYPFLPPGPYKLQVKAINCDDIESTTPAEYAFRIRPPYWLTWWFRLLGGILAFVFLVMFFQWRGKRIKEKAEAEARKAELEMKNRQLVTMQRMELMGNLAAGTVHDLKNLISIILGYSDMMKKRYHNDGEASKSLDVIRGTADTAEKMARQILAFASAPELPQPGTVDLRGALTSMLDTLKVTKPNNVQIRWEPPAEPFNCAIHPARFQQLAMNLCINAFQAMPQGGTLHISLSSPTAGWIELKVADTGTAGIKKEHLDKIFEPLFSTKRQEGGTGLGLFVVKRIVTEYNGKIQVGSAPGRGTVFTVRLPREALPLQEE